VSAYLCEKPLATTYADAKELFDLAKQKSKVLMACQSLRFLPERLSAKSLVDNGEIGRVFGGDELMERGINICNRRDFESLLLIFN
jgi:predicted dehydrogenase